MKITIDLNSPEIQGQIQTAITAKINELVAGCIQSSIDEILLKKTGRMTDSWLEKKTEEVFKNKVNEAFVSRCWGEPTEFNKVLTKVTERAFREFYLKH